MRTPADQLIDALRTEHNALADLVKTLDGPDLVRASGATEWTVAQVLSHLGSGSEISLATLEVAITGTDDRPADALLIRPDGHIATARPCGFERAWSPMYMTAPSSSRRRRVQSRTAAAGR